MAEEEGVNIRESEISDNQREEIGSKILIADLLSLVSCLSNLR